ncbi:MAG: hypothetical protein LQ343_000223 [Gyalolechia ehrenbergii]|nr:MAG: hypothetical protein LQ343_000223 [Gyalolechia ehrenbergii]
MSPPTSPLKSRDVNTSLPSPTKASKPNPNIDGDEKPRSMEYHRQLLQSRLEEDKGKHTYVSPSDMILSPATKKLEALKGKRFGKAKGQSLFANTMSKNVGKREESKGEREGKEVGEVEGKGEGKQ